MSILASPILPEELEQLAPGTYRFKGIDTSPLAKWLSPKWDALLRLMFPPTVAPNVLTVGGCLLLILNFYIVCMVQPLSAGYLPEAGYRTLWVICAFNCFWGYALDCMDGKQARRTGTSSALGELTDHGCDAFSIWTITYTLGVLTQYADNGPLGPGWTMLLWMFLCLGNFFLAHWESYNTHQFFLPWSFDVGEISVVVTFLFSAYVGHGFWTAPIHELDWIYPGMQNRTLLGAFTTVMVVLDTIRTTITVAKSAREHNDWARAFEPLIYILLCFGSIIAFSLALGTEFLAQHIQAVVIILGFDFCNVVTRLVLAHVAELPLRANYMVFVPLWVSTAAILIDQHFGYHLLSPTQHVYFQIAVAVINHMDYAIYCTRAFCARFNIHAFHIPPPK